MKWTYTAVHVKVAVGASGKTNLLLSCLTFTSLTQMIIWVFKLQYDAQYPDPHTAIP